MQTKTQKNKQLALILCSIVIVFFIGIIVKKIYIA